MAFRSCGLGAGCVAGDCWATMGWPCGPPGFCQLAFGIRPLGPCCIAWFIWGLNPPWFEVGGRMLLKNALFISAPI